MRGIGAQSVAKPRVNATTRRDVNAVRAQGRFGDSQLAHLSPRSDAMLKRMGGAGSRNPTTGLKEHFSFKDILSVALPVALNVFAPGAGSGIGEAVGLTGGTANVIGNALLGGGIGALTGGGRGAALGALSSGALAGFNELGGFKGIGDALGIGGGAVPGTAGASEMPDARGLDLLKTEVQPPGLEGVPVGPGEIPTPPAPSASLSEVAASAPTTRGSGGVPTGTTADKSFLEKYKTPLLLGGGALLLGSLGAPQQTEDDSIGVSVPASFGGPLPKYELDRSYVPLSDEELRNYGRAGRTQDAGTGIFYEAPNRYKLLADGGKAEASSAKSEKWNPFEKYEEFRRPGAWRGDEVTPNAKPSSSVRKAADRLSQKGRNGDTILAHINPQEAALLKSLGGAGSTNPETGLLEFGFGSDTEGGADQGVGGGTSQGATERGAEANAGGTPSVGPDIAEGGRDEGARAMAAGRAGGIGGFNDTRTWGDRIGDWVSTRVNDIAANPARTAINAALALTPFGMLNTLAGLAFGQKNTLGGLATAAARDLTDYYGEKAAGVAPVGAPSAPQGPQAPGPGIGNFAGGDAPFYVPAPTQDVATAAAPSVADSPSAVPASPYQRSLTVPTDAQLLAFGRGGGGNQNGIFYDAPNYRQMADGGDVSDGRSDDVPAMLSHGEHVVDAETVSLLGNGSNDAGHARLEKMKADIRKRKGKALSRGKISPNAKMPKVA
ncbi:MAG: hypothetical protein E6Q97_26205 [Desulfurellales bacterium]|nr:MAG: hypothetical protein E6Q97_26205 [Desulfurellales bacterium]